MDSDSKYHRIEEEYLIPYGFGWTVMVMALYIAVVILK
jgi:neutral trehalase